MGSGGAGLGGATKTGGGNLQERVRALADEVSGLVTIKDEETMAEGDAAKPENVRKAAFLRASHSLLRAVERLLAEY